MLRHARTSICLAVVVVVSLKGCGSEEKRTLDISSSEEITSHEESEIRPAHAGKNKPTPSPTIAPTAAPIYPIGSGNADLIVVSTGYLGSLAEAGSLNCMTAVIKNIGTESTPAGVVIPVGFYHPTLGRIAYASISEPIAPGASVSVKSVWAWRSVAGTHTVTAHVDDSNRIAELSNDNNKLIQTFTVGPAP